jgi:allophanate hydrolase subunit 1
MTIDLDALQKKIDGEFNAGIAEVVEAMKTALPPGEMDFRKAGALQITLAVSRLEIDRAEKEKAVRRVINLAVYYGLVKIPKNG